MSALTSISLGPGQTRAAFLLRGVLAAGAVAAGPLVRTALAAEPEGDLGVLRFALLLEQLQAAVYAHAVAKLELSPPVRALTLRLRDDERAHVDTLETAIASAGSTPPAAPTFSLASALADEPTFLKTANTLEDTGVSAYNGIAPVLHAAPLLATAGAIVGVEARHAALVRLQRDKPPAPLDFDRSSRPSAVDAAIAPYRGKPA